MITININDDMWYRLCCIINFNIQNDHAYMYYHYHKAATLVGCRYKGSTMTVCRLLFAACGLGTQNCQFQDGTKVQNGCFKTFWIWSQMGWWQPVETFQTTHKRLQMCDVASFALSNQMYHAHDMWNIVTSSWWWCMRLKYRWSSKNLRVK